VNVLWAVILGIIQGLTEFLPISSTAHLTIAGKLFGVVDAENPESWTAFMAVMQLGTMAAVLIYFRMDLWGVVTGILRDLKSGAAGRAASGWSEQSRLGFAMVIGTIPVLLIGFFLRHVIEGEATKSTMVIIGSLVCLAALLWLAEKVARHAREVGDMTWKDALLVGLAQALALIPGSSRSGTTMTAALFLGFTRAAAARFSFLLSVPAVLTSGLYQLYKVIGMMHAGADVFHLGIANLVVATVVSGLAGYAAIAWLLRYLMRHTMMIFVWYRFALGIILTLLLMQGLLGS
jgi:undecaprenyl-diphosphatase